MYSMYFMVIKKKFELNQNTNFRTALNTSFKIFFFKFGNFIIIYIVHIYYTCIACLFIYYMTSVLPRAPKFKNGHSLMLFHEAFKSFE